MAGGVVEERIRTRVRRLREHRDWTQPELAERLAKKLPEGERREWANQPNISKYESGKRDIDIDLAVAFAAALGVPFSMLIGPDEKFDATLPEAPLSPIAQGLHEALKTGRLNEMNVLGMVNGLRTVAGLPSLELPRAHTRARKA